MEKRFGLIGSTVSHSFSKAYFDEKFFQEGLRDYHYDLYPLPNIDSLPGLLKEVPELAGLNVTLPYKEQVMKYLTALSPDAKTIGAVNVIRIQGSELTGYNTDSDAFLETLQKWFPNPAGTQALILGTGGSAKAVQVALQKMNIPFKRTSREKGQADYVYADLGKKTKVFKSFNLIINTTPLGMSPQTNACPPIDYESLGPDHYVYDLIYNPARTLFLQKAEMHGCNIKNGLEMLHVQAEKSWRIWNR
jgi:shikimate dehydrogenase